MNLWGSDETDFAPLPDEEAIRRQAALGQLEGPALEPSGPSPLNRPPVLPDKLPASPTPENAPPPLASSEITSPDGAAAAQTAGLPYANVQGFDFTKLSTGGGSPGKYTPDVRLFSQALAALNLPPTPENVVKVAEWMTQHGGGQTYVPDRDRINGIDTLIDEGRGGWWYNNQPGSGEAAQAVVAPPPTSTPSMPAPPAAGLRLGPQEGLGGGSQNSDVMNAFREALLRLMADAQKPANLTSPALAGQSDAYHVATDRAARRQREALAERMAFEGLNAGGQGSGAFETGIQGIQENAGEKQGAFDAGLVGQEVAARRQQLTNALQIANAVGARTEALALQKQLADLDNQFRYASLGQQQGQFEDTTAFNYANLQAELNRQALLSAMNG